MYICSKSVFRQSSLHILLVKDLCRSNQRAIFHWPVLYLDNDWTIALTTRSYWSASAVSCPQSEDVWQMLINQITVVAIIHWLLSTGCVSYTVCRIANTNRSTLNMRWTSITSFVYLFAGLKVLIFGDCSTNFCSEKFMFVKIKMQIVTLHLPVRHLFLA